MRCSLPVLVMVIVGCSQAPELAKDQRILIAAAAHLWPSRFDLIEDAEDNDGSIKAIARHLDRAAGRTVFLKEQTAVCVLERVKHGAHVIVLDGEHARTTGYMLTSKLLGKP
jgi:hypothetical protein